MGFFLEEGGLFFYYFILAIVFWLLYFDLRSSSDFYVCGRRLKSRIWIPLETSKGTWGTCMLAVDFVKNLFDTSNRISRKSFSWQKRWNQCHIQKYLNKLYQHGVFMIHQQTVSSHRPLPLNPIICHLQLTECIRLSNKENWYYTTYWSLNQSFF